MIKLISIFYFFTFLFSSFSAIIGKKDAYLVNIFLYLGVGTLVVGISLSIIMVMSVIKDPLKSNKPISVESIGSDQKRYMKERRTISSPFSLVTRMSLFISLTEFVFSWLIFALLMKILHTTTINLTDIFVSFWLNFLLETLTAILILPRIGEFKEVKPGEIKIFGLPDFYGGLTIEVITLSRSRHSLFKTIIFIGADESDPVVSTAKAHELGHAKEHHGVFLELASIILISLIMSLLWPVIYAYMNLMSISTALITKTILATLAIGITIILLLRVMESRADSFTFKTVGESAYDNLVEILRRTYGKQNVNSTKEAPLHSRLTHTSLREALKTGDPLSSLGLWEFPVVLSFIASTIAVMPYNSVNLIVILFPLFYVGTLAISFLIGVIFFPLVSKYYRRSKNGGMNFSFLLAGLYVIMSTSALDSYPNLYFIALQLLIGITLISLITKAFLDQREIIKVVIITLLVYVGLNALIGIIRILFHGV
ncbi:hypothetical protein J5U21_01806 [Saccharolobus shibatae]|uniref:Peptidase M48 domain-containing protein n=2 Tax=Saccharolobus shibatae TaxID=2286 RepID=A0A8F5BVI6_9CREN|nr:hypothetical protein J5U21_01806 [Saccharolobus shibatae]